MADRKTSEAKEVKMSTYEASLLDRYGVARNDFEHARDPLVSQQHYDLAQEERGEQGKGGVLSRDELYKAQHVPAQEKTQEQAKPALNEREAEEKASYNEELIKRFEARQEGSSKSGYDQSNSPQDREHDRDYENSR